jgi:phage terminase large subunit GpA-like protein
MILGVDDGKQQVMNRLAVEAPGPSYFHFPLDGDAGLEYRGYDQLYFKGIISEHKRKVKKNGVLHTVWETTAGVRNEPLDLRVYNLAAMQSCKPDWERLQMAITGKPVRTEPAKQIKSEPQRVRRSSRRASKGTSIW